MEISVLRNKINEYRKKLLMNELIKGSAQFVIFLLLFVTIVSTLEYFFWFSASIRTSIFYLSLSGILALLINWVGIPLGRFLGWIKHSFTDEDLAREIGGKFPEVQDKLINALQLERISDQDNSLINASIDDYIRNLRPIPFSNGIDLRVNFKYGRYLGFIMLSIVLISFVYPDLYKESTKRVIQYNVDYQKPMPFQFVFDESQLEVFQNEPLTLRVETVGSNIPDRMYFHQAGRKLEMRSLSTGKFQHTITNVTGQDEFYFSSAEYRSTSFQLLTRKRAALSTLSLRLDYPKHTKKQTEIINDIGGVSVPEGTMVTWNIKTNHVDEAKILIEDTMEIIAQPVDNQLFKASTNFFESSKYDILLNNQFGGTKENIGYDITVEKDAYPTIDITFYVDTILYEYAVFSGEVTDDYGVNSIAVYQNSRGENKLVKRIRSSNRTTDSYFIKIDIKDILADDEKNATLFVTVTDNDLINRFKSTRSRNYSLLLPTEKDIENSIAEKSKETNTGFEKSIDKAKSINEKIDQLKERLLSKPQIEWQEEKLLNELIQQRKELEKQINDLQGKFEDLNKSENKFNDRSEEIKEKAQQLQKIMDEVLDEETKKLYEELQKLMEENAEIDDLRNQLDKMDGNESSLEEELERALELFKRLKVESELEKTTNELEELAAEQEELAEESKESLASEDKQDTSEEKEKEGDIQEKQQDINEKFEELQKSLEEIQKLNQELKSPQPIQQFDEEMEDLKEDLKNTQEMLNEGKKEESIQQQQKNSKKMQELAESMTQMMQSSQMEMISEDIDNLRNILDNLVKLSFEQERLIDEFYKVTQVDPKFVQLSQEQLKLKEDSEIIQDSLEALASRVFQLSTMITREVDEMNSKVDQALGNLRERDRNKALGNQQYAMTSINNLALLLDDLLQQMQNSMASGMSSGKPQQDKQNQMPGMKQLQKQLSEQIKDLKKSGMKGRKLSEQLAKMAAQQEMLREKMNELQKGMKGQEGGKAAEDAMKKAMQLMEENEEDLVNKRLTQQLIERQEDIMTRMLEAEDAMKEQEFDDEREAEQANEIDSNLPKAFQEYLLERKKQIELRKTLPVGLNPFYKKEVNDYFRRLSTEQ